MFFFNPNSPTFSRLYERFVLTINSVRSPRLAQLVRCWSHYQRYRSAFSCCFLRLCVSSMREMTIHSLHYMANIQTLVSCCYAYNGQDRIQTGFVYRAAWFSVATPLRAMTGGFLNSPQVNLFRRIVSGYKLERGDDLALTFNFRWTHERSDVFLNFGLR